MNIPNIENAFNPQSSDHLQANDHSRSITTIDHRIEERCPEPGDRDYWSSNNPDILIPFQPATAIYLNSFDQIVIRQEDQFGDEDDVIFISRENLPGLIERLKQFIRPSIIETAIEGSN